MPRDNVGTHQVWYRDRNRGRTGRSLRCDRGPVVLRKEWVWRAVGHRTGTAHWSLHNNHEKSGKKRKGFLTDRILFSLFPFEDPSRVLGHTVPTLRVSLSDNSHQTVYVPSTVSHMHAWMIVSCVVGVNPMVERWLCHRRSLMEPRTPKKFHSIFPSVHDAGHSTPSLEGPWHLSISPPSRLWVLSVDRWPVVERTGQDSSPTSLGSGNSRTLIRCSSEYLSWWYAGKIVSLGCVAY